ncbi:MAG: xanthine permease [Anaerolineales bacterium]|nr:xanthine permease [Anaerolineales bacterium]
MASKNKTKKSAPAKATKSQKEDNQSGFLKQVEVKNQALGYLPNDFPPIGQIILLGFQHALTMFPATVLVALIVGFHPSVILLTSGMATIVALLGSYYGIGKFIPLYYGSSFSYLAAILAVTNATFGQPVSDELISIAQAGVIVTGLINILIGVIIRFAGGKRIVDMVLPPVVTGSVAAVIGFALGKAALDMASGVAGGIPGGSTQWWSVAVITLFSTILFSVYLRGKGFIGMLPILLGAIVGYVVAAAMGMVNFDTITQANLVERVWEKITFPNFTSEMSATAIISISIMAIATIPESTAHLYQIGLYVDHLADEQKRERYGLSEYVGFNLVLDGIGDMINGMFGGAAGTNYGENNSLMVISRNYSGISLLAAAVIAILMAFSGHLAGIVTSIPTAVSGGLAIYLFGVIGMQGIALMITEKVDMFDPKNLAIGATIMVIGIGGHIGYNSFLPIPALQGIFPSGWPAIATGAVVGIVLNLIFRIFKTEDMQTN